MSSDGSSNDDNAEEIGNFEDDSDVREIHVHELPRKQNIVNIDDITALDNFDSLSPPEQNVFHYSDVKASFVMSWHTHKKRLVGRFIACSVATVCPCPRGDRKNV